MKAPTELVNKQTKIHVEIKATGVRFAKFCECVLQVEFCLTCIYDFSSVYGNTLIWFFKEGVTAQKM